LSARRPACVLAKQSTRLRLPGFVAWAAWRVLAGGSRKRISVLHVGDPVLSPLAVIARAFGVPTVVTIHGLDVVYPHSFYRAYLRCFLRGFAAYVCISEAARSAAVAAGVPVDRTRIIGVGIDVARSDERPCVRQQNRLLFIGRLVPRKGVEWFVRNVLPRLVTTRRDLRLAIIGEGPERSTIESVAHEKGVAAHLEWLGGADDAIKSRELARATLCVMPNIAVEGDIEGFGIVALEAAMSGCPIVASRLEGLRDAITDGESGVLVPPGDADAWMRAVEAILADPAATARAGAAARAHVLKHRGWDRIIDAYERLFAEIARPAHPGHR
ncbi:MAG TPA: glycosyltransferase family 4 protein, partial [Casimicrobiaceae bacterium]|nr:glycosyltransferase family 4 protein [Casimicrobiaceae bacterium]